MMIEGEIVTEGGEIDRLAMVAWIIVEKIKIAGETEKEKSRKVEIVTEITRE